MVNNEYMYVSTLSCEVCGRSSLIYVKIEEYQRYKAGDTEALSNPNYEIEQLVTGLHPVCADDMYDHGDIPEPLTPEEEEEIAPPIEEYK